MKRLSAVAVREIMSELKKACQISHEENSSLYQCSVKPTQGDGNGALLKEKIIRIMIGIYKNRYIDATKRGKLKAFSFFEIYARTFMIDPDYANGRDNKQQYT